MEKRKNLKEVSDAINSVKRNVKSNSFTISIKPDLDDVREAISDVKRNIRRNR